MKRFSRIVPVLVGMLLLTAAVLKTENLPLEEKLHDGLLGSRVFLVSVIAGEFLLAAWLLSGLAASRCRQVTMGLFALFALVALAKGLSGAASCGCFGRYEVNPWWTFFLDLGVLSLLRLTPHTGDVASKPYRATRSVPGRIPGARPLWTTMLCLLVAMVAAGRMVSSRTSALEGVVTGPGGLVILEPEKWLGNTLPIATQIDIGGQLAKGRWTMVLFHHDCPKCQEALPEYEALASRLEPGLVRIALIEVPPYGPMPGHGSARAIRGHLSDRHEWFVQAPLEITLVRGIVTRVSSELPSLAALATEPARSHAVAALADVQAPSNHSP